MYEKPIINPNYEKERSEGIDHYFKCPKCGDNLTVCYEDSNMFSHSNPTWVSCHHPCNLHWSLRTGEPVLWIPNKQIKLKEVNPNGQAKTN